MAVPLRELARRLCVANHRADLAPGREVPCSVHTREAKLYIGLTEPAMAKTLATIIEASA